MSREIEVVWCFFFFNDTATTEIYTLSLHDALPICISQLPAGGAPARLTADGSPCPPWVCEPATEDRKSTRLNSSHANISYAVFCLKKKTKHCTYLHYYLPVPYPLPISYSSLYHLHS